MDRSITLRLLMLARPHAGRLILATICLLISTAGFLAVPYVIRLLTDSVFVHHDIAGLNRLALLLLLVVVSTAVFGFWRGYLLGYVGGRIVADLRVRLYEHLLNLPIQFYDEHRSGDLMSRLTADSTLVQSVVTNDLLSGLREIVTLGAVVVLVFVLDWRLALVTLALGPVVALVGVAVGRRTRRLSTQAQEKLGVANTVLEETLGAMRVVTAFGRQCYERNRYASAVEASFDVGLSATRLRSMFEAVMLTTGFAALTGVLWFGGREVLAGRLTPGGLLSFLFYLTMLIGPLQGLASLYGEFQQAAGGAARIFEMLDTTSSVVDAPDAYPLPPVRGEVEIRDVWFRYVSGRADVLRGLSFTARPGQRIALVGPSGAGKTTLISLLARFYDPTRGAICLDGHAIARVTLESLRAALAIVPQEPTLFGGTVRENIGYGKIDATDAEIELAARAANAHVFIAALPNGYDTVVGDRGVKLSGGQRQRIAIARAVLKDPRVLILDEATSALDNESESLVQEALERLTTGRTSFVIAHRLTTVETADCIVVLDDGCIVEQGTHAELMARDGLYARLYSRDFAGAPALSI